MKKYIVIPLFVVAFLLVACGAEAAPPVAESAPTIPETAPEVVDAPPEDAPGAAPELVAVDCLNGEISPIAESIAADYDHISYEQVVTWFCNGAEYEDILVALETEALTDVTAEELLQMLAEGSSWEGIWQFVGLTE